MVRHEPDEDGRCRATELLVTECSGCRGSDTSLVDALTTSERPADYEQATPNDRLAVHQLGFHYVGRGKWWLDTGPATELIPDSHPFRSNYNGSLCKSCRKEIKTGQRIVHVNVGGYTHVACLEAK